MTTIKFGTDGWRGIIAKDFTFSNVRLVAQAVADTIKDPLSKVSTASKGNKKDRSPQYRVILGYDRRFQSQEFARQVAQVLLGNGIQASLSDSPVPSPVLSFSVKNQGASLGIMITASHNPYYYNGVKIKTADGTSSGEDLTRDIESHLGKHPVAESRDGLRTISLKPDYLRQMASSLNSSLKKGRGIVIVDCLYGCGHGFLEALLPAKRYQVITLHAENDPLFGNINPEPIEANLEALKKTVLQKKALLGIALDGDADRLGVIDDQGVYLPPHHVFPLILYYLTEVKKWHGKVVQAVSLGYLSERIAKAHQCPWEEVPVGFKHVSARFLAEDVLCGGEESGGYAFRGGVPERDGIRCGLLLLEMLAKTGKRLSQLVAQMEKQYGVSRFLREDLHLPGKALDKTKFIETVKQRVPKTLLHQKIQEVRVLDGAKIILESGFWVLLRPSGTEPLVRLYAETDDVKKTQELLNWAKQISEKTLGRHSIAQEGL